VLCRLANRVCSTAVVRRALSVPAAEHQTDPRAYGRRQRRGRAAFLDEFGTDGSVNGDRVLDLGCGMGANTFAVVRAGASEVIGVDLDVEKVRCAAAAAGEAGEGRARFAAQSGAALAFDAGRFDVVLLLDVIEHLPDPAAVLAECARVLRTGGRLLVTFPPYRSPWGAHLFTHVPVPWAQLLFRDAEILDLWRELHSSAVARGEVSCSAHRERAIIDATSTAALWDCNGMTIERFLDQVEKAPLALGRVRTKVLGNLGGLVAAIPMLREYLVTRVSAVLEA